MEEFLLGKLPQRAKTDGLTRLAAILEQLNPIDLSSQYNQMQRLEFANYV